MLQVKSDFLEKDCGMSLVQGSSPAYKMKIIRSSGSVFAAIILCSLFLQGSVIAQKVTPFKASQLVKTGDNINYGAYVVYKTGEGIYQIHDPGFEKVPTSVDMYLVCGKNKALLIDLGNNYFNEAYAKERGNAANELREIVNGLVGKLPLEIAITHMHPDHNGMTNAFINKNIPIWVSDKENLGSQSSVYKLFTTGEKTFDLGGGKVIETFLVRGHSNGGTIFILKNDKVLFTGDALGSGLGQAFRSVQSLKLVAEDSKKLVDYIYANFSPYERYEMKVFTGHADQNKNAGYQSPNKKLADVGYLNWLFIQNVASCANGILEGKWLVERSGLHHLGDQSPWRGGEGKWAIMVYGIGTILIPIEVAYESAGLEIPK
jgi:glyoxylase-like metal-dependent hydrolase (beta-lactamase superfamily II)